MTAAAVAVREWKEAPIPAEVVPMLAPGTRLFYSTANHCKVLVSQEAKLGWHLSISHPWRYPTWDEIKAARYALTPDNVAMAMILPPSSEFVNVHENCFHLYECRCPR